MIDTTLSELASNFNLELKGRGETKVKGANTLASATSTDISFILFPKYLPYLKSTKAAAVLITPKYAEKYDGNKLICDNPRLVLGKILKHYQPKISPTISSKATIGQNCKIGENVNISANVVVEDNVVIGHNTTIGPNSVIHADSIIGANCCISSGVIVGSHGFGFAEQEDGWFKLPHIGKVIIEDNVDIGSGTCIDRGFLGDTVIHKNVILDNLIQIGHNVVIGENTAIAASSGIAGSTSIGSNCMIGGGARIAGHIEIADKVILMGASGVSNSILKPGIYSSVMPVKPHQLWAKNLARFNNLDEMAKKLNKINKQVLNLISENEGD